MKTVFLLLAQYDGRVLIPLSDVCRDFFAHLTPDKLVRKAASGEVKLPIVRMDPSSQKSAKGIHVVDLADYIDACRQEAADRWRAGLRP